MAEWHKQDGGARDRDVRGYPQRNGAPHRPRKTLLPLQRNGAPHRPQTAPRQLRQVRLPLGVGGARYSRQRGAGLAEALLATALLAITALGLLEYRQRLAVFQRHLQDVTLALSLSHQSLELMRQPAATGALARPPGWRVILIERPCAEGCRRVTATVIMNTGERISLSEWICQGSVDTTRT